MDIVTKRQYELNYILPPELGTEDISAILGKMDNYIKDAGGEIKEEKQPERTTLAYPIKNLLHALRGEIVFESPTDVLNNLEKNLKLEKNLLRYWILHLVPPSKSTKKMRKTREPALGISKSPRRFEEIKKEEQTPAPRLKKEEKVKLEEIDKKLEEILGM